MRVPMVEDFALLLYVLPVHYARRGCAPVAHAVDLFGHQQRMERRGRYL